MTDLPKFTPGEMQNMLNTIAEQNNKAYGLGPVKPAKPHISYARRCPCKCSGCRDPQSGAKHCLTAPCTRKRNRRNAAEIAAAERYDSGRVVAPNRKRRATPEQVQGRERYPSGRLKPNKPDKPKADPMRPLATWFVTAHRNFTEVTLPAPRGRDEAYAMAGHLFMHGWSVQVVS